MGLIYVIPRIEYMHDHPAIWGQFLRTEWHVVKETGELSDRPVEHYLEWRRDLDRPRFDFNHPGLAALFAYELKHQHHPEATPFPIIPECPVIASCPVVPPPSVPFVVGTVAEPSGVVMMAFAGLFVVVAWVFGGGKEAVKA